MTGLCAYIARLVKCHLCEMNSGLLATSVHDAHMQARVGAKKKREGRPTMQGLRMRQWRLHRKMSLTQLAQKAGTTHSTLSRIETGCSRTIKTDLIERIARALDIDSNSLITRHPGSTEKIWSLWERVSEDDRRTLLALAESLASRH